MKGRIASLAGIACAAAALALAVPAMAAQGASPAASGTEHFQLVSTSATSTTAGVIAYGVFTAPAIDHQGVAKNVDKFVFSNGSFKVRHRNGTGGTQSFNPRTCLAKISQPGTYTIFGGTGKYAGITGHGKFRLSLLFIGAKSAGKCVRNKPPVAFQQIIRASGPVTT